jgi:hypothetical protein
MEETNPGFHSVSDMEPPSARDPVFGSGLQPEAKLLPLDSLNTMRAQHEELRQPAALTLNWGSWVLSKSGAFLLWTGHSGSRSQSGPGSYIQKEGCTK